MWCRVEGVAVKYPEGLEDMVHGWKLWATARLFLQVALGAPLPQDMMPDTEAAIFLDTDTVLLEDPAILWDRQVPQRHSPQV